MSSYLLKSDLRLSIHVAKGGAHPKEIVWLIRAVRIIGNVGVAENLSGKQSYTPYYLCGIRDIKMEVLFRIN
jgi:hypothetical protein